MSAGLEVLACVVTLSSSQCALVEHCLSSVVSSWQQGRQLPTRPSVPNREKCWGEMAQSVSQMSTAEELGVMPGPLVGIGNE